MYSQILLTHDKFSSKENLFVDIGQVAYFALFCRRTTGSGKAMKLGSKTKDVDNFVDKLRSEGTGEDLQQYYVARVAWCS